MQFISSISFVSALLLLGPAAAVDITFYNGSSANCGGEPVLTIRSAQAATCYTAYERMPTSVQISSVPLGAGARAYNQSNCGTASQAANGDSCLSAGGSVRAANWSYNIRGSGPSLMRKTPDVEPRFSVTYEQPGGGLREVEVPSGHVRHALGLVEARDYNALAEYPTVRITSYFNLT